MNEIQQRVKHFKEDRRHGASQLLSMAMHILKDAARDLPIDETQSIILQLDRLAAQMAYSRPSMVNIENAMAWYRKYLHHLDRSASPEVLREIVMEQTEVLHQYCLESTRKVISNASRLIEAGSTIMTCSFSSTVSRTLKQAWEKGAGFSVLVLQSCWQNCCYGGIMHQELQEYGIKSRLIEDAESPGYLHETDLVILGGDSLLPDGTLINGFPSRELAMTAASLLPPVPVIALLETIKISRQVESGQLQEGFQAVPFNCLFGVLSEEGLHQNLAEIWALAKKPLPEELFKGLG